MMATLLRHKFFPQDEIARKALEKTDPFALRAKGLDQALLPEEFARALFHINQRRGFKSNRKTDKKENDSGALKTAIGQLRRRSVQSYRTSRVGIKNARAASICAAAAPTADAWRAGVLKGPLAQAASACARVSVQTWRIARWSQGCTL